MAWSGMKNYGFKMDAERLAYRWLYMVTVGFVEAGGVVPEKVSPSRNCQKRNADFNFLIV